MHSRLEGRAGKPFLPTFAIPQPSRLVFRPSSSCCVHGRISSVIDDHREGMFGRALIRFGGHPLDAKWHSN
jgi:hypothetical protein